MIRTIQRPRFFLLLTVPLLGFKLLMMIKHSEIISVTETVVRTKETPRNTTVFDIEYHPADMEVHMYEFTYHNYHVICRDVAEHNNHTSQQLIRVRYRMNCHDMFENSDFGTGNLLLLLYNIRQAVFLMGHVELEMRCIDAVETQRHLILPWIMGTWKAQPASPFKWKTACEPVWALDGTIFDDMRYELRRMSIALVGVPSDHHPARQFELNPAREETLQLPLPSFPLLPNTELDQVAVHFRCGDILEKLPHPEYGYAKFHSLATLIPETTTSIGIVTQPFHNGQTREPDKENQGRCSILVEALQSFLQQRFPQANVTVRNDSSETIALAYARFIMARQSIAAGTSTFVTMPFRASFGTVHEISRQEMIDSVRIFDLWQEENGQEQILNLFTSSGLP